MIKLLIGILEIFFIVAKPNSNLKQSHRKFIHIDQSSSFPLNSLFIRLIHFAGLPALTQNL